MMEELLEKVLTHVLISAKATGLYLLVLLGPGLILALGMHLVSSRVKSGSWSLMGSRAYLALFGWLGTAVHELGHMLMCFVFLHKVEKVRLFSFNPEDNTLGYVKHSYNPRNPYHVVGNFFIALGPILLGTALLYGMALILLPGDGVFRPGTWEVGMEDFASLYAVHDLMCRAWESSADILLRIFDTENALHWQFWVFMYMLVCVGGGMSLSPEDISGGFRGFVAFVLITYVITVVAGLWGGSPSGWVRWVGDGYALFYPVMAFALVLNALLAILLTVLNLVFR